MSRTRVVLKRIGKLLKFAAFCLLAAVIILLIWRVFSTSIPNELNILIPNEKLKNAYAQKGENLYIFEQNYDPITRGSKNAGYFSIEQTRFIPDANQAQVVFRYNNSTIKSLATDYKLSEVPNRETELFDVSLIFYVDLTPDNKDDNFLKNAEVTDTTAAFDMFVNPATTKAIRLHPTTEKPHKTNIYNFYKYVYELDASSENLATLINNDSLVAVHAEVYYNQDIDYKKDAYGIIRIYDQRAENIAVSLTNEDKDILKAN